MKKVFLAAMCLSLPLMISGTALALPLVTYTHNYGDQPGQFNPGGNDVLSNGYVTVSDKSSDRFNDAFDFSSLSFNSITSFDLTLTYSGVGGFLAELWYARPGGTPDQYTSFRVDPSTNITSVTYEITSTLDPEFGQMVAAKNFFFWFAEETWFSDSFKLYSAVLTVDGEATAAPVPEPATMLLFGTGIAGLAAVGRRKRS